jgi:RNA polymerase sigma-70 factor, ECF subfamily
VRERAVLYADSGGKALAPPEPLRGAVAIARFMVTVERIYHEVKPLESEQVRVNGQPGRIVRGPEMSASGRPVDGARDLHVWSVLTVDVSDGQIQAVRIVGNPDKLSHL